MSAPRGRAARLLVPMLLAAITAAAFAWVFTLRFTTPEGFQDFGFHNQVARELAAGAPLELPHPLYHVLTAALASALRLPVSWAGVTLAVLAQTALALVAFFDLRVAAGGRTAAAALIALGLTVVAPLNSLTPATREFYFGYLFPNALHNPTVVLLRPLALALFLACAGCLAAAVPPPAARAAGLAALTLLCGLAKPSYLICILPAIGLLWLAEGRRWDRRWRVLAAAVVLPGLLLVAAQAWFTLTTDRMEPATIVFAPLKVVFIHTKRNIPLVAMKLVLSVAFPLAVLAAFHRDAAKDASLRLAWAAFLAGAFYAYGLAESGERMSHGNFLWSGQAAAAVLFAASARFALERARTEPGSRARLLTCAVVFALHVAAGIQYAVHYARTGEAF